MKTCAVTTFLPHPQIGRESDDASRFLSWLHAGFGFQYSFRMYDMDTVVTSCNLAIRILIAWIFPIQGHGLHFFRILDGIISTLKLGSVWIHSVPFGFICHFNVICATNSSLSTVLVCPSCHWYHPRHILEISQVPVPHTSHITTHLHFWINVRNVCGAVSSPVRTKWEKKIVGTVINRNVSKCHVFLHSH